MVARFVDHVPDLTVEIVEVRDLDEFILAEIRMRAHSAECFDRLNTPGLREKRQLRKGSDRALGHRAKP